MNASSAIGAAIIILMAHENNIGSQPSRIPPALLEWAEYWYPISWKGVLAGGIITAIGACATIAFLLLQWRTTSLREDHSEWRTSTLELQTAKANEGAAKASAHAAELSVQAEELRKGAAEANAKLGATQADVAKANAEIAAANERTEVLRRQNLELENAVAPRLLSQWPAAAPLKQFPGIRVFVGAIPDFEARRLAGYVVVLCQLGDWKSELTNLEDIWREGVEIEYEGGVRFDPQYPDDIMRALEHNANALQGQAAEALAEVLRLQKIEANVRRLPFSRTDKPRRPGVPSDAISVKVGAKPTRYFMDQRIPPEIKAKIEEAERNAAEIIERSRRARGLPDIPK
ncbi:MAG: hypothetical protein ABIL01_13330 [Pseudomonadota bacterium]